MANSNGWGDGAANNAIGWGQGANNSISWGKSHSLSNAGATDIVGLTTDADAQAFITAAAITDATQQSAIDTLVKGLKTDGVWTKMKAIYPFVGGTASTHKYNLKDPRDLDAAFRLVFNGGWTHSSTGATPNGTNGYADTKLVPSSVLSSINNLHLSHYSRTQNSSTSGWNMGVDTTSPNIGYLNLSQYWASVTSKLFNNGLYPTYIAAANNSNTLGLAIGNVPSSVLRKLHFNGAILNTTTNTSPTNLPNTSLFIGSGRNSTTGLAADFTPHQNAFTSIGDGLTDTEASNLYTRVQAYQTALSRNV